MQKIAKKDLMITSYRIFPNNNTKNSQHTLHSACNCIHFP